MNARRLVAALVTATLLLASRALADPYQGHASGVPSTRTISTTSPLGGGGALSANLTLTCTTCVTTARTISTTAPLQGGGALSANLTLSIDASSGSTAGSMSSADFTKLAAMGAGANAIGAASSTDNSILRADGTGGKTFQDSGATTVLDDSGRIGLATAVPTHSLTLASTSTGLTVYTTADQVTNFARATLVNSGSIVALTAAQGGSGTLPTLRLASSSGILDVANAGSALTSAGATNSTASFTVTPISALSSTSAVQSTYVANATVNQTSGTGGHNAYLCNPTLTAIGSAGAKCFRAQNGGNDRWWVDATSGVQDSDSTITAAGTTGNQTINKPSGTVNVVATGTALTVTNSLVTANSIISVLARTNDTTCRVANYVPAAGSFVINMTAACAAETSVGFAILDKN